MYISIITTSHQTWCNMVNGRTPQEQMTYRPEFMTIARYVNGYKLEYPGQLSTEQGTMPQSR